MSNPNEQHGLILTPDQEKILDELRSGKALSVLDQFKEKHLNDVPTTGAVQFIIGIDRGKVILDFGATPICWIGLSTTQAKQIAEAILKSVDKIENGM